MVLFGFLILALSLYQVQIVPQENAEVEFQHFEEVRNDLVELRAAVLQAGSLDQPQYQTVQLGTTYPTRVFTINPPAPAGTIRTTDAYPITISNGSGTPAGTVTIPTRFIEYRPGYTELDRSSTWYDASVLYLDARGESGGIAVIEDQALVNADGEVKIVALQNEFRQSGTGRTTIELYPAESVNGTIPEGDLNVTVPTRLSGEEYWDGADIPINYSVTGDANDDGIHNLTLETTADDLTVDTVGVQEVPEDPTQNADGTVGGGDGGGGGGDGGDGSGSNDPQVDRFDVTDQSGKQARFDVTWEVSDGENNLDTVTVDLIDESGAIVDTVSNDVSGGTALDTNRVSETGNPPAQTYTVRLTVTDASGNTVTRTRDVTYSG
ncbi:hypothetical protein [Halorubrum sp. SP9]|uniref:hypothetical protein n=1 Tax=Halorubrum sp. SP9 TaxID=1537267 RepID=UPI001F545AEE|nr:hypothetical protein [Halorubrum sp. SP9]